MRKLAPAAFLISGIIVFGGLFIATPAQADDEDESSSSQVDSTPRPHAPHPEQSDSPRPRVSKEPHIKRNELEQKYGKDGRLSLPPLVIRPTRDTDEISDTSVGDDDDDDSTPAPTATTSKIDKTGTASAGRRTILAARGSSTAPRASDLRTQQ
mgnify:CR=1 FL=1